MVVIYVDRLFCKLAGCSVPWWVVIYVGGFLCTLMVVQYVGGLFCTLMDCSSRWWVVLHVGGLFCTFVGCRVRWWVLYVSMATQVACHQGLDLNFGG